MIRGAVPRALLRQTIRSPPSTCVRPFHFTRAYSTNNLSFPTPKKESPTSLFPYCRNLDLVRSYATGAAAPGTFQRADKEAKFGQEKLRVDPENVTSSSSTMSIFGPDQEQKDEEDVDMMAGIRHDLKTIQQTFALNEVPVQAYRIGLAGVLPYLATSTATMLCAFELNTASLNGGLGYFLSEHTAELALQVLEPLQVGYGAVILSCLGTIHWGLEWAGYGGYGGYRRYAIGVLAPAVAWPTILLPVEYALISQFLAFNILYAVDASATRRGWTPPWYGTYRFILTFVVGASIVLSLIGRGQVESRIGRPPSAAERVTEKVKDIKEDRKNGKKKAAEEEVMEE